MVNGLLKDSELLSIKIILLAGLKLIVKFARVRSLIRLSIKIILLAGLKRYISHYLKETMNLSIKIILLAGLKLA